MRLEIENQDHDGIEDEIGRAISNMTLAETCDFTDEPEMVSTEGIHVFATSMKNLSNDNFLANLDSLCWKYLVADEGSARVVAEVDLACNEDGELHMVEVKEESSGLAEALDFAAVSEQLREGTYFARVLLVPEIQISALWLSGKPDIFYLLPSPFHTMEITRGITASQFRAEMQGIFNELPEKFLVDPSDDDPDRVP